MPASTVYRDVNKGRTVIQEQEEISRNHVQTFIYLSVPFSLKSTVFPLLRPVKHLLWLLCVLVYYERAVEGEDGSAGRQRRGAPFSPLPPSLLLSRTKSENPILPYLALGLEDAEGGGRELNACASGHFQYAQFSAFMRGAG